MTVKELPEGSRFKAAGQWYTLRRIGQGSAVVTIGDDPRRVTISLNTVVDKTEKGRLSADIRTRPTMISSDNLTPRGITQAQMDALTEERGEK